MKITTVKHPCSHIMLPRVVGALCVALLFASLRAISTGYCEESAPGTEDRAELLRKLKPAVHEARGVVERPTTTLKFNLPATAISDKRLQNIGITPNIVPLLSTSRQNVSLEFHAPTSTSTGMPAPAVLVFQPIAPLHIAPAGEIALSTASAPATRTAPASQPLMLSLDLDHGRRSTEKEEVRIEMSVPDRFLAHSRAELAIAMQTREPPPWETGQPMLLSSTIVTNQLESVPFDPIGMEFRPRQYDPTNHSPFDISSSGSFPRSVAKSPVMLVSKTAPQRAMRAIEEGFVRAILDGAADGSLNKRNPEIRKELAWILDVYAFTPIG